MTTLQLAIETAHETGYKAGEARKQHDESRAKFHSDWFRRYLALQPESDRKQLRDAFDAGYRAGRNIEGSVF